MTVIVTKGGASEEEQSRPNSLSDTTPAVVKTVGDIAREFGGGWRTREDLNPPSDG